MLNLTIAQALSVWTDLVEAEFGKNGFGGDTAEIYAYRLQPCNPSSEGPGQGRLFEDARREQGLIASRNLYELLTHFRDSRGVDVFVGCGRFDDGKPLGEWLIEEPFNWRTQVRVRRKVKENV